VYTHWNFSGLELVNERLVLKSSVSGTKSRYFSVQVRRLRATDDRLRIGASDCRRPLLAMLALVDVVIGAAVPLAADTLPALLNAPNAMLWRRLLLRRPSDDVDVDMVTLKQLATTKGEHEQ